MTPVANESSVDTQLRGRIVRDAHMSRFTSWRAGGIAQLVYVAADLEDACAFLAAGNYPQPLTMLGLGSNLLVRDGGLDGTLLRLPPGVGRIETLAQGRIRVQAGVGCPKLARFALNAGLAGAEFLAGIPGSIGGALAMNAGCYGSETWEHVASVDLLADDGSITTHLANKFDVGYRSVEHREGCAQRFAAAEFVFASDAKGQAKQRYKQLLAERSASQPIGSANAGSVFANPAGGAAGKLLEQAGMHGARVGHAAVSAQHANFIVNEGCATASEIEQLIENMHKAVADEHGIDLRTEVRVIGKKQ